MSLRPLDTKATGALTILHRTALAGGGYERLGVRGWLLREEIERATALHVPELLPRLAARRLLDRDDVRLPQQARPSWLYRITSRGSEALAGCSGDWFSPPQPLGTRGAADAAVYVPKRGLAALDVIVTAWNEQRRCDRLPGENGWITLREILAEIRPEWANTPGSGWRDPRSPAWEISNDYRDEGSEEYDTWSRSDDGRAWEALSGETPRDPAEQLAFDRRPDNADLMWLVAAGLVQRWVVEERHARPTILYRVTLAGLQVVPLRL